jgi:tyrosyl-tRNA synthetase
VATVPLLEGIDGVEKMSKSKGNYIGITEPPKVMFRKVMQISDALMWRYYELLTDQSLEQIAERKRAEQPMKNKLELAGRIVADFHSQEAAAQAMADFDREVRQGDVPADIETVPLPESAIKQKAAGEVLVNVDKLVAALKMATSVTDARKQREQGAVKINPTGDSLPVRDLVVAFAPGEYTLRVGKKWKRVSVA